MTRPDGEGRSFLAGFSRKVTAHRYAVGIRGRDHVLVVPKGIVEVPAAEETQLDAHATGGEGFLALHAIEERGTGVFLSPDGAEAGWVHKSDVAAGEDVAGHAFLQTAVLHGVAAEVVVLSIGCCTIVRIRTTDKTELVRVVAASVLHRQTVFKRIARVAARDFREISLRVAKQVGHDFEIGELVVW